MNFYKNPKKCPYYLHFTEVSPIKWNHLPQDTHLFTGRVGMGTQVFLMAGSILFPLYRKYLNCSKCSIMRGRSTEYILERFTFRMVKIKALVWKPYFALCPLARSDLGISVQFIRKSISGCHGYEYGLQSQTEFRCWPCRSIDMWLWISVSSLCLKWQWWWHHLVGLLKGLISTGVSCTILLMKRSDPVISRRKPSSIFKISKLCFDLTLRKFIL